MDDSFCGGSGGRGGIGRSVFPNLNRRLLLPCWNRVLMIDDGGWCGGGNSGGGSEMFMIDDGESPAFASNFE